ncbi:putative defense protein Hdd11-like [Pollicipes pollicipes]|uniref:putative defense protein Hdd11-like n=1 Tax=Pollicipes pollicipes TaxID=41117 RepID=UPI001884F92D|nr:putative defense protein Hdd11-like [Pollicipes pollicipes]
MRRCPLQLLVLALGVVACRAYSGGAPAVACGDMTPGHGVPAQSSTLPYRVVVSDVAIAPGDRVTVTISREHQMPFKGFFVQARRASGTDSLPALGSFTAVPEYKLTSCGEYSDNGISHRDSADKHSVSVEWVAPADLAEDVVFRVTLVQSRTIFWVGHDSARLRLKRDDDGSSQPGGDEPPQPGGDEPPQPGGEGR